MKKEIKILFISLIIIIIGILSYIFIPKAIYSYRIKHAIIKVSLVDDLHIEFNSKVYVDDLIKSINGELLENNIIDTSVLGQKTVKFYYINEENLKIPYSFDVMIVDKTPPKVLLNNTYSVAVGSKKKLEDAIFCGDNYDDNPKCEIIGEYDLNKVGKYPLIFVATDFSNNQTIKKFTLNVYKPSTTSSGSSSSSNVKKIPFEDIKKQYKTNNNRIGLDVSKWQGNIDYQKVKDAGVEFVFIKIGGTNGIGGEFYLDPKFKQNIEGFQKVGMEVGVYFYSYANSVTSARNEAEWVIKQLKDNNYKIDLPIAFDWENWSRFNSFNVSFNTLTNSAEEFIKTVSSNGYKGLLYSSKYYLENIWLPRDYTVWLAHYTSATTYKGDYKVWQMTSSCAIPGIDSNTVDVDIMY